MERIGTEHRPPGPEHAIRGTPLVYFDLETTGLHVDKGATIEEAAVRDAGGVRLHWRCDSDGANPASLVRRLVERFDGVVVVGHNVTFDLQFVADRAKRLDVEAPTARYLDTLGMAREHADSLADGFELEMLAEAFDLEPAGEFHRAIADTEVTRRLFWCLVERAGLETLGDAGLKRFELRGT
ncbi:MAG: 3'-5' exonuclease [Bradymonadaceae bacterium]